jgi:hypothetical protein
MTLDNEADYNSLPNLLWSHSSTWLAAIQPELKDDMV